MLDAVRFGKINEPIGSLGAWSEATRRAREGLGTNKERLADFNREPLQKVPAEAWRATGYRGYGYRGYGYRGYGDHTTGERPRCRVDFPGYAWVRLSRLST